MCRRVFPQPWRPSSLVQWTSILLLPVFRVKLCQLGLIPIHGVTLAGQLQCGGNVCLAVHRVLSLVIVADTAICVSLKITHLLPLTRGIVVKKEPAPLAVRTFSW